MLTYDYHMTTTLTLDYPKIPDLGHAEFLEISPDLNFSILGVGVSSIKPLENLTIAKCSIHHVPEEFLEIFILLRFSCGSVESKYCLANYGKSRSTKNIFIASKKFFCFSVLFLKVYDLQ